MEPQPLERSDSFADSAVAELERLHREAGCDEFLWLDSAQPDVQLVRAPGSDRPFLVPYVPFVGPNYQPGGVLLFATAQSLTGNADARVSWWGKFVGYGDDALFRLYRQEPLGGGREIYRFVRRPSLLSEVAKENVAIGPYASGVLLAMAGLLIYARSGEVIDDLDRLADRIAVTNLYKFSLLRDGRTDFNPKGLADRAARERYAKQTLVTFLEREVEILRPGFILAFDVPAGSQLLDSLPVPLRQDSALVSDPACIRRGWHSRSLESALSARPLSPKEADLVNNYLNQCDDYHRTSKRTKTTLFLSGCYRRFTERGGR